MFERQKTRLTFNELNDSQQRQCLIQMNKDVADRSIPGTFIYLLIWFCIGYLINGTSTDVELIKWINAISILMFSVAVIRIYLIYLAKKHLEQLNLCRGLLIVGMILSSLTWGVVAALPFLDTPMASQKEIIIISTVGICGGGVLSFYASRLFIWLFLGCMLLPILIVNLFIVSPINFEAVSVVTIYSIGLLSVTKQPYREYLSSLISYLKLEENSNTDALTGIRNRRFFDNQLIEEVHRANRSNTELSLILLDADHFKQVNDKYGHPVGDKCLVHIANHLKRSFNRVSDTVARFGGEEFAVILPNTSSKECAELAEKVRRTIEESKVQSDHQQIALSISLGCYSIEASNIPSPEELIQKADKALYQAKELGRNRVVLAGK